jgi:hypothetical protein
LTHRLRRGLPYPSRIAILIFRPATLVMLKSGILDPALLQLLAFIRTGDTIPCANLILESA